VDKLIKVDDFFEPSVLCTLHMVCSAERSHIELTELDEDE